MTTPTSLAPPAGGYAIPVRYWAWLGTARALSVLLWAVAGGCLVGYTYHALHWFDTPAEYGPDRVRADGNNGHAQIDFGGQWVMGRMIATGNGRRLYHRQALWRVVRDSYPVADESPVQRDEAGLPRHERKRSRPGEDWKHDATNLMVWFMGSEDAAGAEWKAVGGAAGVRFAQPVPAQPLVAAALEAAAAAAVTPAVADRVAEPSIGGPLYPPVHAVMYAPLGLFDRPQRAYHAFQVFGALLLPVAGLAVSVLSRGRIWWSVATLGVTLFPGTRAALDLGQNPTLSLCVALWGWVLVCRGYQAAGGVVWGLFAFKPVWAVAFLLVPLLMRRWRVVVAMAATGAALCAATLPVVGVDAWRDWLQVGRMATAVYETNDNWIHLSRDVQGLVRRVMIDFGKPDAERGSPLTNRLAYAAWGAGLAATAAVYALRADRRRATGVGAAFLFLGAFLSCFHFMYYDTLLAVAALAVLFADPRPFVRAAPFAVAPAAPQLRADAAHAFPAAGRPRPFGARMLGYVNSLPLTLVAGLFVGENSLSGLEVEATVGIRRLTVAADGTERKVPHVQFDTGVRYPLDTFLLLSLWAWCGWRLVRGDEEEMTDDPPMTHQ